MQRARNVQGHAGGGRPSLGGADGYGHVNRDALVGLDAPGGDRQRAAAGVVQRVSAGVEDQLVADDGAHDPDGSIGGGRIEGGLGFLIDPRQAT